jgi:hypothetical protein
MSKLGKVLPILQCKKEKKKIKRKKSSVAFCRFFQFQQNLTKLNQKQTSEKTNSALVDGPLSFYQTNLSQLHLDL